MAEQRPYAARMAVTASRGAADALRRILVTDGLREGDRLLPERDLADQLDVSRPTVREALSLMVQSGLLVARQGSGTFVAPVNLIETMELRRALEPVAAAHAAERRDATDLAGMHEALDVVRATVGDPARFAQADADLHELVRRAARQSLLEDVLSRLDTLTRLSRSVTSPNEGLRRSALVGMDALVCAIDEGDPRLAEAHMVAHLDDVTEALGIARRRP